MAEHANEYLTLAVRISQGSIADNLWPILDRRRECSTTHRGMPRTALVRHSWYQDCLGNPYPGFDHRRSSRSVQTNCGAPRRDAAHTDSYLMPVASKLLQLNRRAGFLELGLEGVGILAAQGLLDGVGGLVDEGLGLLQAESCRCPDDLYDLDLLLAGSLEHDVELDLLLFGGGSAVARRASGWGCCYGCGGDAEALLQGLHQFRELENGHVLDRLH